MRRTRTQRLFTDVCVPLALTSLSLFTFCSSAEAGEDRPWEYIRAGARSPGQQTVETHGQTGGWEKVGHDSEVLHNHVLQRFLSFGKCPEWLIRPFAFGSGSRCRARCGSFVAVDTICWQGILFSRQNPPGEVGPTSFGSSLPKRCIHGDRLTGEHDAAYPLPEEWGGEAEEKPAHHWAAA